MMKYLWFLRHGHSRSQASETSDLCDPELSDFGVQQAEKLREVLGREVFDLIVCSPLRRTRRTLQVSGARAPVMEFDSRAIECVWAIPRFYEGLLPYDTPDLAAPDRHDAWLEDTETRVRALLGDLLNRREVRVLLVGHWGLFDALVKIFMNLDPRERLPELCTYNASLSHLEVDDYGVRRVRYWNEHAHVRDMIT
jgi:broad specificity phosphatase PhoE